jgi:lactate dehydrogenase-like 2-hydroxyacid dehydrogenase
VESVVDKPWVAVTRAELPGEGLARLAERAQVRFWTEDRPPRVDELVSLVGDARAALCVNGDPVTGAFMDRCSDLRLVSMASVGYDSVDVAAAGRLGISVTNTPGVLAETVADFTFALILWSRRRLGAAERYLRAGEWGDNGLWNLLGLDIHGATLGIVGYGAIGRAVAVRAAGFGMRVIAADARVKDAGGVKLVSFEDLLAQSDIVSLHVPLTAETRGLIGERELRLMKPTATLVNTARGGVIDQPALIRALNEGWIHSAGLDVQEHEPNPDPADPLLSVPNLVVLPHVGSATLAARSSMVDLAVDNVLAFLDGKPLPAPVPELDGRTIK